MDGSKMLAEVRIKVVVKRVMSDARKSRFQVSRFMPDEWVDGVRGVEEMVGKRNNSVSGLFQNFLIQTMMNWKRKGGVLRLKGKAGWWSEECGFMWWLSWGLEILRDKKTRWMKRSGRCANGWVDEDEDCVVPIDMDVLPRCQWNRIINNRISTSRFHLERLQ